MKMLRSTKICAKCGSRIFIQGFNYQHRISYIMKRDGICYDCAFWEDLIEYPPKNIEILGTKCLKVYPGITKKELGVLLGGKGKTRYFLRTDRSVICSNDIWIIGEIPKRFKDKLQPTIIEITEKAYKQLKRNNKQCQARACFDRYHCFRYNLEWEKEHGPFNIIPQNWRVGNERCRFRIDPSEILTDESSVQHEP